ncbi:MAG: hypothetical protein GXO78_00105 [Calditrichaeota bacterium]|nr:hypothetical protein [Calditrichota bacterium]
MEANLVTRGKTRRRHAPAAIEVKGDLLLQLYELLQGERGMVRVYSRALQSDVCFVNPAVQDPETLEVDCPVYTTRELAFVLSLSEEEFRRFHYLKTRLIG